MRLALAAACAAVTLDAPIRASLKFYKQAGFASLRRPPTPTSAPLSGEHCPCLGNLATGWLRLEGEAPVPADDVAGPPPNPLREIPREPCAPVDLDGASEVRVLLPNAWDEVITLRADGAFTANSSDWGCADPAAALGLVLHVKSLPQFATPLRQRPQLERATGDVRVAMPYQGDAAFLDARRRFLSTSLTDGARVCFHLCAAAVPPILFYDYNHISTSIYFSQIAISADGWFFNAERENQTAYCHAGRFETEDVRRAIRWLRARSWRAGSDWDGLISHDGYSYRDVVRGFFARRGEP